MQSQRRQLNRLLGFVERMKLNCYPNAESYARELRDSVLAASVRTIKRDLDYLQDTLDCPFEYDPSEHGYALIDEHWAFPLQPLCGAEIFPNLVLGNGLELAVHSVAREAMYAPVSLINPEAAEVQALLPLVLATNGVSPLEPEVAEDILYAWKERQVLWIDYMPRRQAGTAVGRDVEVHGVFSQEGIWYARCWCRLRDDARTFALHRIQESRLSEKEFTRRPELVASMNGGNILGYKMVKDVKVHCAANHAGFYEERVWFAEQYNKVLDDGTLEMFFSEAPRPVMVSWILYNAPELQVVEPRDLRAEIEAKAAAVAHSHQTDGPPGPVARDLHDG